MFVFRRFKNKIFKKSTYWATFFSWPKRLIGVSILLKTGFRFKKTHFLFAGETANGKFRKAKPLGIFDFYYCFDIVQTFKIPQYWERIIIYASLNNKLEND